MRVVTFILAVVIFLMISCDDDVVLAVTFRDIGVGIIMGILVLFCIVLGILWVIDWVRVVICRLLGN